MIKKTINVLKLFQPYDTYDYIVRTNVSTICNFYNLEHHIQTLPTLSYGGHLNKLSWLDPGSGIKDNSYHGLNFISGTCIILTKDTISKMLENIDNINYSLVDDVSIGVLLRDIKVPPTHIPLYFNTNYEKNIILYRNNTTDRESDISRMSLIVKSIIDHTNPEYP